MAKATRNRFLFSRAGALRILVPSAIGALLLAGCFATDEKDDEGQTPTPAYTCLTNDSLCISRAALIDSGATLFTEKGCAGCHGENADGVGGEGCPPLANSDYFMAVRLRPVYILLQSLSGTITVNGQEYNGFMPALGQDMRNSEVAALLTYLRSRNDSTVVSCTTTGCVKTPRSPAEIAVDSIAVWEVKHIRDSLAAIPVM